jgi:hypothetical protein
MWVAHRINREQVLIGVRGCCDWLDRRQRFADGANRVKPCLTLVVDGGGLDPLALNRAAGVDVRRDALDGVAIRDDRFDVRAL